MRGVTQTTIARQVGLSRATVAAVLNPNSRVQLSDRTRQRVMTVAKRLGYYPNRQAQMMRRGRSGLIGVITQSGLLQTAWERTCLLSNRIQEAGYGLTICDWTLTGGPTKAVNAMLDARVEGVILAAFPPGAGAVDILRLQKAQIPVVGLSSPKFPGISLVTNDARQGVRDLVRHLIHVGHRQMLFLAAMPLAGADENQHWPTLHRAQGFCEAIRAVGGKLVGAEGISLGKREAASGRTASRRVVGELVNYGDAVLRSDPFDLHAVGYEWMRRVLGRRRRPEAVVFQNDDWAVGAIAACTDAGVRLPGEIAITGFDNTATGRIIRPALTTVAQPQERLVGKAMELLLARMHGPDWGRRGDAWIKLPCEVVVRQSCGAVIAKG